MWHEQASLYLQILASLAARYQHVMPTSNARNFARRSLLALAIWLAPTIVVASAAPQADLFFTSETLSVSLTAPWRELVRHKESKSSVAGGLKYATTDGAQVEIPIRIKPRGKHRLETCRFPPLRLKFEASDVLNTAFAGHEKLKLVTHCSESKAARQWVRKEYLAYRLYAAITDASFRVRWASIEYVESAEPERRITMPAFFIEDTEAAAHRLAMSGVHRARLDASTLDDYQTSLFVLFQYMIGNTDWSVIKGPEGKTCCHNSEPLESPDHPGRYMLLPYDFDQAGLVNAAYAAPDPRLGISSVRTRLYRGLCRHNDQLSAALGQFQAQSGAIYAALEDPLLDSGTRKELRRYVDDFFRQISDPRRVERELYRTCRGPH